MRGGIVGIISQGSFLNLDTREKEEFFLQCGDIFFLELTHENLRRPTGVAAVLSLIFNLCYSFIELRTRDLQTVTKSQRVPLFTHITHGHRDLVDGLVKDQ